MKRWPLTLLAALPVVGVGCSFAQNVRRNVVISPLYAATDRAEHHRHMKLAREAYKNMALTYTDQGLSCDYREGFVDGFVDFLDNGGVGEPPPIPPPQYRYFGSINPEGLTAMEEWKNGFRHGAATARASRIRELVTVPVYWGPKYTSAAPAPRETPRVEPLPPPKSATQGPATETPDKIPMEPVTPK